MSFILFLFSVVIVSGEYDNISINESSSSVELDHQIIVSETRNDKMWSVSYNGTTVLVEEINENVKEKNNTKSYYMIFTAMKSRFADLISNHLFDTRHHNLYMSIKKKKKIKHTFECVDE